MEEQQAELYCHGNDVLFGDQCYAPGASAQSGAALDCRSFHVRRTQSSTNKHRSCKTALPTPPIIPSYPARSRCKDPNAELDPIRQLCFSTSYWDKTPVCTGWITYLPYSTEMNSTVGYQPPIVSGSS